MMSEPQWYVLKVVNGQEKKIKSYLETEVVRQKLEDYIVQILIPTEKVYEMRAGKKRIRERNFFPGYVLACADLSNGEAHYLINNAPNVIGFLTSRGYSSSKIPVALTQVEVNRIIGRVDDNEDPLVGHLEQPYIVGETVKLIDGAFSGFTGEVREILEDKKKLSVIVRIFDRNTPLELKYTQVEKVD